MLLYDFIDDVDSVIMLDERRMNDESYYAVLLLLLENRENWEMKKGA